MSGQCRMACGSITCAGTGHASTPLTLSQCLWLRTVAEEPGSSPTARRDMLTTMPTQQSGMASDTVEPATESGTTATRLAQLEVENERLREEMAEWESAHTAVVELRGLVESHMDTARGQWECVAENERLRAVVEAAQGIALRDSPAHQRLREALAALKS